MGESARHTGIKVLHVGGWLTHGDVALETGGAFLLIAETMLVPARSRNEGPKLRRKKMASIWSPACQDTSLVGAAGVVLVSLKGDPVSMPSIATPEFKRYWAWEELSTGSG